MAIQLSVPVRNARLDSIETLIGNNAVLQIRSGAVPADCAAANSGTLLASITLPNNYFNDAANGSKTLNGTWQDSAVDATGTAQHWRIFEHTSTTCHMQGTITATGGGGDMTVNDTAFVAGQIFNVTTFTITDGNA